MLRALSAVIVTLVLTASLLSHATATQAQPAGRPALGATVTIIGPDGGEIAQITTQELVDPFQHYNPNSPPERGSRYVLLTVTVSNTGSRPLEVDPNAFALIDTDGFIYDRSSLNLPSDAPITLLEYQNDLAPGAEVSGTIGFQVLNSATLTTVAYIPQSDRLITLADLGATFPAPGTPVTVRGNDGSDVAGITVSELTDPFTDYDASSPPQRGNHYVLVSITITNTGVRPFEVNPSAYYLVDTDGFRMRSTSVYRDTSQLPDLQYAELAPGDSVSGAIGFEVLNGVTLTAVVYAPQSDRSLTIDDLTVAPVPSATPVATVGATPGSAASGECEGLEEWWNATYQRFRQAQSIIANLGLDDPQTVDVAAVRQAADDFATFSEDQAAGATPTAAQAFNDALVSYLQQISQVLSSLADAVEAGDLATQIVILNNLSELDQRMLGSGGEIEQLGNQLGRTCPELLDLLG